ncbi:helix-turn-helix domain-containing protein [Kaistella flava (ex Peng et al. 2021)]|uniref:helix-turn-helix domain-containing protein n=1 Tax=Kaistella flava (ex Peng et al. 2021) TaxID=2038776 RepID=UPI0018823D71|nr:helix-turn-helix domain-containing protein [Kaistella flava (ex Peng et al. 2021)]
MENSFIKLYENPDVAIHAAKEVRNDGGGWFTKDILTRAYLLKGDYLSSVRDAFEKSTLENENQELLSGLIIAREFYFLNLYEQTSKIIEPLLQDTKSTDKKVSNAVYAKLFQLNTRNLIALKKLDEAEKSLLKSSNFAKNNKNSFVLILKENEFLKATIALEKGNRPEARKIADRLLKDLSSLPRATYLFSVIQQFRGQLFFEEQHYDQAIECLNSSLNAIDKINYIPLKSSIYEDLAKNYLVIKNNEEFELYKNKYRETSKLLEEDKKEARLELIKLSTELSTENNKVILHQKKMQLRYIIGISLLLVLLMVYIFIREVQKSKTLIKQIKFFRTINFKQTEVSKEEVKAKEPLKKQLIIPKETEKEILNGLQQFEQSKKYLDNNMSLPTLAGELNTNTKYLSEIINKYKDKNFNSYINELRIKYIIHLLSTDRSYLQYKISYIAEIGGFTSHSAFTNIFKAVTGMSPHEYMQTLRKD